MYSSYLCFSGICEYIKSLEDLPQVPSEVHSLVLAFLKENEDLLLGPAKFNELGPEIPSKTSPLKIKSTTYDISKDNWKDASRLSRFLSVNYEQSLRIVSQSDARGSFGKNRLFLYAQRILQERNAILDTTFLILNGSCSHAVVRDELIRTIAADKVALCLHLIDLISDMSRNIQKLDRNNSIWSQSLQNLKDCQDVIYVSRILEVITLLIMNTSIPVGIVSSWFALLKETNYLSSFANIPGMPREVHDRLEALATVNTVLIMGLDVSTFSINTDALFFNDVECFKLINNTLLEYPSSAIVLYCWSLVLSIKEYLLEENPEQNAKFFESVFGSTPISRVIALMVNRSENLGLLKCFSRFSDCLEQEKLWSVVLASLLAVSLNFMNLTTQVSAVIKDVLNSAPRAFVEKFLTHQEFEKKISLLRAKLPLLEEGLLPMINLTSVHSDFANFEWKELNTYTEKLSLSSLSYDLAEITGPLQNNTDFIVLKKELLVRPPLESQSNVMMPIPKDTRGKIIPISSTVEDAVIFMHDYNGWSLLGRILQNICDTYVQSEAEQAKAEKSELAVAIIDLIAGTVGPNLPIEKSTEILQHLSGYVEDGDIVSVLFRLFELALHARDLPIINAGLRLMIELTPNFPHFVWTHLARSYLIDRNGKEGLAVSILGNIERMSGIFTFSILLIKLTNSLVSEALTIDDTFPERMKRELLGRLMTHAIHIYEGIQYQNYTQQQQRLETGLLLTALFTKVLFAVYGIDPSSTPNKKVTAVLGDAAQVAIEAFLNAQTTDARAVNSLISIITFAKNIDVPVHRGLPFDKLRLQLIEQSFELANLLISIRSLIHLPPSKLEQACFSNSITLVDLYASHFELRIQVIKLLTHLVRAPFNFDTPSLLSYLGDNHSKMLLRCIAYDLKGPSIDQKLSKSLYNFFSAIMEGKQDGLAILFLTGKVVTSDQSGEEYTDAPNSILTILKKNAMNMDSLPQSVSSHLLDAIAYACNTWTAARSSESDADFIKTLVKRLEDFKPEVLSKDATIEKTLDISNKYKVISRIAEILALSLFTSSSNNQVILDALSKPSLAATIKSIFHINSYDTDLQEALQIKFKECWPRLDLSMFTSSPLLRSSKSFQSSIFDVPLMDQYFGQDERWVGSVDTPGFRSEVIAASVNIQFATYQVSAAKSWGALLTSFIRRTPRPLNDTYVTIVGHLMDSSNTIRIDPSIYRDVYLARIELAFYILYSFLKTNKSISDNDLKNLLLSATDMIKSKEIGFLDSIIRPTVSSYYRPLIRSVLIILSLVKNGTLFVESVSDNLLEYFELTFGRGVNLIMSSLLSEINIAVSHGKKPAVVNLSDKIQDLFLLLSSFTKIKSLQLPASFEMVLASSLNEVGTIKTVLNLYSSSHLLNFEEEPVLCELALTFITELCSINDVAEKLISNGLFSVLLESPISVAIQNGKVVAQTQPRLHTIWSDGLLTIILQLLSKFGKKVLPECCLFVSYFSKQISSSLSSWTDQTLAVSNAIVKETSQLIMLQRLFAALDYQEYLTDANIRTKVVDDCEVIELFPGLDSEVEKRELYASFSHLLTHPKYLNSRIVSTTLEEQRALESDETRSQFVKGIMLGIENLGQSLFSKEFS